MSSKPIFGDEDDPGRFQGLHGDGWLGRMPPAAPQSRQAQLKLLIYSMEPDCITKQRDRPAEVGRERRLQAGSEHGRVAQVRGPTGRAV